MSLVNFWKKFWNHNLLSKFTDLYLVWPLGWFKIGLPNQLYTAWFFVKCKCPNGYSEGRAKEVFENVSNYYVYWYFLHIFWRTFKNLNLIDDICLLTWKDLDLTVCLRWNKSFRCIYSTLLIKMKSQGNTYQSYKLHTPIKGSWYKCA